MVPTAAVACILPATCVLFVPSLQLGTWYFLFEDILPDPHYRERSTIILTFLLRTMLSIGCCETGRCLVTFGLSFIILANNVVKYLRAMLSDRMSFMQIRTHYKRILILATLLERAVGIGIWLALTALFWSIVLLFWIVTKGSSNLPLFLYLLLVLSGICILAILLIMLDMVARMSDLTTNVVKRCQRNVTYYAKVESSGIEKHMAKILLLQSKALRIYKPPYGRFMKIDRGFVENFLYHLIDKTATASLTF